MFSSTGMSPSGKGAIAVFFINTLVPAGIPEKSTRTSARSPGAIVSSVMVTGAFMYPPSVPICMKGKVVSSSVSGLATKLSV